MASSSAAISGSTTSSPSLTRTSGPSASAVDKAARTRISPPSSPTTARLSGAEPARNPIQEKYQEARRLIDADPEGARALFLEIIRDLPKTEDSLLYLADCKIGLAYTYPLGNEERIRTAVEAKQDLDQVYEKRSELDTLGEAEMIHGYRQLRMYFQQFEFLAPRDMKALHADVASKIDECNRHIPLLSDFYEKLGKGVQSLKAKQNDLARELFAQALHLIEGHSEPDYLLARAFGMMNLASTYPPGNDLNRLSSEAQVQTFAAYEQREALFTNEKSKLTALNLFSQLFDGLSRIMGDNSDIQRQIREKYEECQKEYGRLRGSAPTDGTTGPEGSGSATSPTKGPKVTKDPVDSWKAARLFIAFGFAAVVIAGAVFLGRRFITRLN